MNKESLQNNEKTWGLFTVSVSVSVCIIAEEWVPLISVILFTLSDGKHREKSLTLMLRLL